MDGREIVCFACFDGFADKMIGIGLGCIDGKKVAGHSLGI